MECRGGTDGSQTRRWRGQSRANPSPKPKFPVRWENTGYSLIFGSISPNLSSESQFLSELIVQIPCGTEQGIIFDLSGNLISVSGKFPTGSGKGPLARVLKTIRAKGAGSRRRPLRSFEGARALRCPALFCSRQRRVPQPRGQPRLFTAVVKGFCWA